MSEVDKSSGKKWPWIIGIATIAVIGFSIATIKVAIKNPVEMSDYGMQSYHTYDDNANDIINAKIAFDQKYIVAFVTPQILEKKSILMYEVKDKSGNPVDNAKIDVVMTRPDTNKLDLNLSNPNVSSGKYTFASIDLPRPGRWDIMAKITVGDKQRYYNVKADTRYPNTTEF